ncbi:MAG: ERF family protein [Tannerella sp.]|jgi:hypothetical protein|nr:ERF family protein [Tannerella sp.]
MNLYEKIQAVATEIMSIEKDMQVGTEKYGYKAVSDFTVTKSVKEAEAKYRLLSVPVRQELLHSEVIRVADKDKDKLIYSFIVRMTTKFIDVEKPEDFIEVETLGHGLDSGDKGFGKASTYARKYSLLNAYKIATGEDPDAKASAPQAETHKDSIRDAVFSYMDKNIPYLQNVLKHFNAGQMEDLTSSQLQAVYNNLKRKNLL